MFRTFFYKFHQFALVVIFKILFQIRFIDCKNIPSTGGILLVSNHQSYLDPMLNTAGLRRMFDYMARDSLFRNKLFAWYIGMVNTFPIRRDSADVKAVREIIDRLKRGRAVTIFPEGTRTYDGKISEFKGGIDLIARRAKATIVPVVIDGAFEVWPRHQKYPKFEKIAVMYGEPTTYKQAKAMGRGELLNKLNRQMRQMQHDLRIKCGKEPYDYDKSNSQC